MNTYLERFPELEFFLKEIDLRFNKALRPANEVIIDDIELQSMLHISKRTSASLREEGKIVYHKDGGRIYYFLSDVFNYVKKYRVNAKS